MTAYGVQPTGYVRKPFNVILNELEQKMIDVFGIGVIQTEESPLGQLNGLMSDLLNELDEAQLNLYQSFDPDQAEGSRLDVLARYRLLSRSENWTEEDFRRIITNVDRARIDMSDLNSAVASVSGVTWSQCYVNDGSTTDADGIPAQHIAVAVLGGDDDAVAQMARRYIVPGIGTYGNHAVQTTIDGFCRKINLIRPVEVPVTLRLTVETRLDKNGCPPPSIAAMAAGLYSDLRSNRPVNGEDGTEYLFRSRLERLYPNVEVTELQIAAKPAALAAPPLAVTFFQIMSFALEDIEIVSS